MSRALLSLGSNIEPERHLRAAAAALRERFGAVELSPVYRTAAVGFDGPVFLNAAAAIDTDLDPVALDAWLHALEDAQGRQRGGPRFGSRTLDVDVVFYDAVTLRGPGNLELPRPDWRHGFVLRPLADVAPDYRHPQLPASLSELRERLPADDSVVVDFDWD